MNEATPLTSESFAIWMRRRIADGPLPTEDVVRALVPLLKQVHAVHDNGMVAPLAGLGALQVIDGEVFFSGMDSLTPRMNERALRATEGTVSSAVEVVSRTVVDSTGEAPQILSREIAAPDEKPTTPCFMPGYLAWEHALDHHDAVTDVFSLGLLLATLALGLDLAEDEDLKRLVAVRRNPFEIHPKLHPVLARCLVRMIEVRRSQRHQDVPALINLLANHRDQEQACRPLDHPITDAIDAPRSRRGRIQARLRDRLFDCSRRNRLLYYRSSLAHLNLTIASVPLQVDLASIRGEDLCTWGGSFTQAVLGGSAVNLGKWLRLEEAPYIAPTLDRIRLDERRDRNEYGASQLRLVVAFLRWHDLKEAPNERVMSPLVLLPVSIERKRGVRDTWTLTASGTEAEINPALRHVLRLRYGLDLPEIIDLAKTSLQDFHDHLQRVIQASEPGVSLRLIERPRIDLVQQRARARADHHKRRGRLTGKGIRRQADIDYSYEASNFQPLGLQIFLRKVKPVAMPQALIAGASARNRTPWMVAATSPEEGVRTRETFQVREDGEANPYAWEIDLCSLTLGNFNYRKMTLVRDYRTLLERDASHPAFDAVFSDAARPVDTVPAPADPTELWPVVVSDPTQDAAVARARSGASYVIQGPPGTGKSQTITNLIADHVARGKRVLFVCAKRAALDVVHHRLAQRGLDRLCCLIHDSQEDKKGFIQGLRVQYEDWLSRPDEVVELRRQREGLISEIRAAADPLTRYAACMSERTDEDGQSLRSLLGRLVEIGSHLPADEQRAIDLPGYTTYQRFASAFAALGRTLREQHREPCLHATGLRFVRQERFSDDRPVASLTQLCESIERTLASIADMLGESGLAEALSRVPVDDFQELVPEARRLLVLAERDLLKLVDRADPANEQLRSAVRERRKLSEVAAAAKAKTEHWIDPIPPGDCAAVLAQAHALEQGILRFVKPGWWRLRKILQARYRFSAHVIAPQWSAIVADLAAAYAAKDALAAYDRELVATWRADDLNLLVTTLEEVHRAGSHGPAVTALRQAARSGKVTTAGLSALINGSATMDQLVADIARLLALGSSLPLTEAQRAVAEIRADLPLVTHLLQPLRELTAAPAVVWDAMRSRHWSPEALEAAILADALRRAEIREPGLATFDLAMVSNAATRLAAAHRSLLEMNARLILAETHARFAEKAKRAALPGAPHATEREWRKQYARGRRELEHEFGKVMRLRSIRDLADGETGLVVADLKPVWLMSPLSVSDTLPLSQAGFDVVVFDEASQIPIEEAVPALYRAPLSVVVGDRQQLPPSDFFGSGGGTDAEPVEEAETGDEDALLPNELAHDSFLTQAATNLIGVMLGWHYRSRSEALIAFSNAAFYDGRLLTIPDRALPHPGSQLTPTAPEQAISHLDAVLDRPISFHHLANAPYEQRKNPAEAAYIAHLVRGLLNRGGTHSIGVVAFSEAQQSEIETAIRGLCAEDPAFRELYEAACQREDDGQHIGLFVKNLENVQGDERDIIILSVCYGHDRTGRMLMNFGPINRSGGEKRLNVVFSRAKHHLVLVSSITADAITNDYNLGALTLKRYLAYAQASSNGSVQESARILASIAQIRSDDTKRIADPVTNQLAQALTDRGWLVDHGVGVSHFRCDLALRHAGDPAHRLGVLIDREHDLKALSTWERDLARPQTLAAFGWKVVSIPALAWWREPAAVLEAISRLMEPGKASVPAPDETA